MNDKNEVKAGNVGIITTKGQDLHEVTAVRGGLVYSLPLNGHKTCAVCLPWQFWVLLDHMP